MKDQFSFSTWLIKLDQQSAQVLVMQTSTAQILLKKTLSTAIKTHEEKSFRAEANKIWQNEIESVLVDFGYAHIIQSCFFFSGKQSRALKNIKKESNHFVN